ncbi:MAG TPA: gamma-glutamyl-gamma-aminobutyrate hydrolase family protein, partial [Opitutales bacterium]|nr:gamma-glutamyl-gamma-aminobutyrate hydrolase family protein [Opitutales bacterium]
MDQLGVEAFSGFIFPGSGDNYPQGKEMFTLEDMPEGQRSDTERLYQKVYQLAKEHQVPTFGICAGAQHLVLHRDGALMRSQSYDSNVVL